MAARTFKELNPGDLIMSLEMNRRTLCPIVEVCKVIRIGKEYSDRVGQSYGRLINLELTDSLQESFEVALESEVDTSIFDRVVYSTSPEVIYRELQIQKQKAKSFLDNRSKYELCIEECDKAMMKIAPQEAAKPTADFTTPDIQALIKKEIENSINPINKMVSEMYQSLMPEKSQ